MSWRRRSLLIILAATVLLASVLLGVPALRVKVFGMLRGESFYAGWSTSAWKESLTQEQAEIGGREVSSSAYQDLKRGGKAALPVLLELALDSNPPVQAQARRLLAQLGDDAIPALSKLLKDPSTNTRRTAAATAADMGGRAKPLVPLLARLLDDADEEVQRAALAALDGLGPAAAAAVPDLIFLLDNSDPSLKAQAAGVLGKIGMESARAVPGLVKCLADPRVRVQRSACQALGAIGAAAAAAVPPLIVIVLDPRSEVRADAAQALGRIRSEPRIVVPALTEALQKTRDAKLRAALSQALADFRPEARSAVPVLLAVLGKSAPIKAIGVVAIPDLIQALPDTQLRGAAAAFLLEFKGPAVAGLLQALKNDPAPAVRAASAGCLGLTSADSAKIIPALLDALADKDSSVRTRARDILLSFGKSAQPHLNDRLRGKDEAMRLEAVRLLGKLGRDVRSSARFLLPLLKEAPEPVQLETVFALANMGYQPKEAVPLLIESQKNKLSEQGILLLAGHGRAARSAASVLGQALTTADARVRAAAAYALGQIGPDKESLPLLLECLKDKDVQVRRQAAAALAQAAFAQDRVVPLLIQALDDAAIHGAALVSLARLKSVAAVPHLIKVADAAKDEDGRAAYIALLGNIGTGANEAVPWLIKQLQTSQRRLEIIEALGRIKSAAAVEHLTPLLRKDATGAVAALAVWRIEVAPGALKFLLDGLNHQDMKADCMRALGRIGPPARAAVPALIETLKGSSDLSLRAAAAQALTRMGADWPPVRKAIKPLADALKIPHQELRISAAHALGQFVEDEEAAQIALPGLLDMLNDPEWPLVRQAAADAILRIDPVAAADAGLSSATGASRRSAFPG
jgi:HEAT repeat protein